MKDGLPGHQVASLLEDREGHLWVGVDDGLFIYENRHFRSIPGPNRSPMGMVVGITEDVECLYQCLLLLIEDRWRRV